MAVGSAGCLICGDQQRSLHSGILRYYGKEILDKSVIYEDEVLYVTPAPGCLTPGYLILSSKRHILSVAEFDDPELGSLNRILNAVRQTGIDRELVDFVAFEHGMLNPMRRGAACIEHAHLHLCPTPSPKELIEYLRKWYDEDQFHTWPELRSINYVSDDAYILLARISEVPFKIRVYRVGVVASQLLRQRLAIQWNIRNEWDWRTFLHKENYLKTLDLFSGRV